MTDTLRLMAESWCRTDGVHNLDDLKEWVHQRNQMVRVEINKNRLEDSNDWYYDKTEGCIRNKKRSFFTITGCVGPEFSQPIILQEEIGYLGLICKKINGVIHFLMQAKIEPGNVNAIQLSPTIQATKSNFFQKHGGAKPPYLEYFLNASDHEIVVDQVQSEQSSRFLKKRNRNIIIRVEEDLIEPPTHRWMTLGQIKQLMREDNLVNMDTRTVLSCIPFSRLACSQEEIQELADLFTDKELFRSVFIGENENRLPELFHYFNDEKMFNEGELRLIPLHELSEWEMRDGEYVCKHPWPFKVVFCDIEIEGREVRHWTQPLFEATGTACFGLLCCEADGLLRFVVRAKSEIGCFDTVELGPSVQQEAEGFAVKEDVVSHLFYERLRNGHGIMFDHLLSEEGGRFYHEQNRNIMIRVKESELPVLPKDCFLLDYRTLNGLVQINNTMNIQLRNLLSLLEA